MRTNETGVGTSPKVGTTGDFGTSALQSFFKINRDSPEAMANQLEWARKQMDLEVPEQTVAGNDIQGREDFVRQYIESEREKFGREVDNATAEREVDEWLLKQATNASTKTSAADIAASVLVFALAFGVGTYQLWGGSSP
jgi:hypothetical protein